MSVNVRERPVGVEGMRGARDEEDGWGAPVEDAGFEAAHGEARVAA